MTSFTDDAAKAKCQEDCDKRNKSILKTHPMRWKPLFTPGKGWAPALRPKLERIVVERKSYVRPSA